MSLFSSEIPSLFNGVSQQPATLRLPNQWEEQVNGYATVSGGLQKRPPFEHVALLNVPGITSAYIHTINRDANERYIVVIGNSNGAAFIRVFGLDGEEFTVNTPVDGVMDYLTSDDPQSSFSLVSVADFTFIVNKTKTVQLEDPTTSRDLPLGWEFYEELGKANDSKFYTTPSEGINKGVVQTFEDLSDEPLNGWFYKVAGYDQDGFSSYYVRRVLGVWEESAPWDIPGRFDSTTMPHALVRQEDGTFDFVPFLWKARQYGDQYTNPGPTFIGRKINDAFFYKNRLGFVSDENVIFSGAGDFGNFWRNTVLDVVDSDVVDVAVSHTSVSILNYAVPFNNGMMLFADQSQFSLNVTDALTPSTVSIDVATEYEMSTKCRPVGAGTDVYFVTESGRHSRVREYFVDSESNTNTATDITAHVPRYLPKGIIKMTANTNEDVLFALSSEEPSRLYVYKFYWNQDGKVQSAWSYWELEGDCEIIDVEVLENDVFILVNRSGTMALERCDIQEGNKTAGLPFKVLLDRQTDTFGIYYPQEDVTAFDLPYNVIGADKDHFQIVLGDSFGGREGSLLDPTQYDWIYDDRLRVPGRYDNGTVYAGYKYTHRNKFSQQFIKRNDTAVTTGRLQLRTFTLYYTDTAFFKTVVSPYGQGAQPEAIIPAKLAEFTGKTLGQDDLIIGAPVLDSGSYSFQIYGDSKQATVELLNDTHVPANFSSAEWEGFYHNRAR